MTTVQERCKDLRENIRTYEELRRARKNAEAFEFRTEEVRQARESLIASLSKIAVFRENSVNTGKIPDAATSLSSLRQCNKLLNDSDELGKTYGSFKRSIAALIPKVEECVTKGIEAVERELPKVDETFLSQVAMIPGLQAQVAAIREKRDRLLRGKKLTAMNAAELRDFLQQRDRLKKDADDLDQVDFPKEVLDFFRAARQLEGAPYSKLTPTVQQWMKDRQLLYRLRIRITDR